MSNYFQFGFRDYPSKDENGKAGHFDGIAKIKCRPNPDYADAWTVDGFHAQRQGNCAALPETEWNIRDLERHLKNARDENGYKYRTDIEALVRAAEEAEGR